MKKHKKVLGFYSETHIILTEKGRNNIQVADFGLMQVLSFYIRIDIFLSVLQPVHKSDLLTAY